MNRPTISIWTQKKPWKKPEKKSKNTKIKEWIFALPAGDKEVWVELKDNDGLTSQCHSDMDATAANVDPVASIACNSISNPGSCEGYSLNKTLPGSISLNDGGLELQNTSTDLEDCPGGIPCAPGFSSCAWDVDGNTSANCSNRAIAWMDTLNLPVGNYTADLTVTDQDGASDSAPQKTLTFKKDIYADFGMVLRTIKAFGFVQSEDDGSIVLNKRGCLWIHLAQNYFALNYVSKIWSAFQKNPWPGRIKL